jgi:hypothetical protein
MTQEFDYNKDFDLERLLLIEKDKNSSLGDLSDAIDLLKEI